MGPFEELIPPQALESERQVLGACLMSVLDAAEALHKVKSLLRPEHFFAEQHQRIYEAILAVRQPDTATVSDHLRMLGHLEAAGGAEYLTKLHLGCETTFAAEHHAMQVEEKARYRDAIREVRQVEKALHFIRSPDEVAEIQKRLVAALRDGPGNLSELTHLGDAAIAHVEAQRQVEPGSLRGDTWGFKDIDTKTGGLEKGKLYIVAARPAMGKTALVLEVAKRSSLRTQKPWLVVSYEMAVEDLAERLILSTAAIAGDRYRSSRLAPEEWDKATRAARMLKDKISLFGVDKPVPVSEVGRFGRLLQKECGCLGGVAIDYLQLVKAEARRGQNRTEVVGEISRGLKLLARELGCPILAAAQVSRGVESREDKRPNLADLRESGSIEQEADVVGFLYRDNYYTKKTRQENDPPEAVEFDLAKVRHGQPGLVKLIYMPEWTRFNETEWRREG